MDLTVKLSIIFGILWLVAIIVEMVWFWNFEEEQGGQNEAGPPDSCDTGVTTHGTEAASDREAKAM